MPRPTERGTPTALVPSFTAASPVTAAAQMVALLLGGHRARVVPGALLLHSPPVLTPGNYPPSEFTDFPAAEPEDFSESVWVLFQDEGHFCFRMKG